MVVVDRVLPEGAFQFEGDVVDGGIPVDVDRVVDVQELLPLQLVGEVGSGYFLHEEGGGALRVDCVDHKGLVFDVYFLQEGVF